MPRVLKPIPIHGASYGCFQIPNGMDTEQALGFCVVKRERLGFMESIRHRTPLDIAATKALLGLSHHFLDGGDIRGIWTKIEILCRFRLCKNVFRKTQISCEWLEHMLPRASGSRIANDERPPG